MNSYNDSDFDLVDSDFDYGDSFPMPFSILDLSGISSSISRVLAATFDQCVEDAVCNLYNAIDLCQRKNDSISLAASFVCLADIYITIGKVHRALELYRRAYYIYRVNISRSCRHNQAVVSYAIGLTYHMLNSELDALSWYEQAERQLAPVIERWAAANAKDRWKGCHNLLQHIGKLTDDVVFRLHAGTSYAGASDALEAEWEIVEE